MALDANFWFFQLRGVVFIVHSANDLIGLTWKDRLRSRWFMTGAAALNIWGVVMFIVFIIGRSDSISASGMCHIGIQKWASGQLYKAEPALK
ncbi:hypothetical protein EMMF5_006534 [Cystobasidiomycetes sp. EMM_F5]